MMVTGAVNFNDEILAYPPLFQGSDQDRFCMRPVISHFHKLNQLFWTIVSLITFLLFFLAAALLLPI
jgi:hypothetical protein